MRRRQSRITETRCDQLLVVLSRVNPLARPSTGASRSRPLTRAVRSRPPAAFLDGSFTIVVCRCALHHFPEPDAVIAEIVRVLRPCGRLGLADLVADEHADRADAHNAIESMRDPSHVCALNASDLQSADRPPRPGGDARRYRSLSAGSANDLSVSARLLDRNLRNLRRKQENICRAGRPGLSAHVGRAPASGRLLSAPARDRDRQRRLTPAGSRSTGRRSGVRRMQRDGCGRGR